MIGKRTLLLPLVLAAALPLRAAAARRPVGLVERLEVTSITRERITMRVRTALAHAPRGPKVTFTGRLDLANVAIPFQQPARVMVQPGGGGWGRGADGVFFVDVDLARVPEALLTKAGVHAIDLRLEGTLSGQGESEPVVAAGTLRLGTPEIRTPAGVSPEFLRFGDARLTDVSLTETSGEASVVLYNPFSFAVPIRELSYQLVSGDRVLASGVRRAVRIRPRQETRVTLPVTARNVDLAAAAGSALMAHGVIEGRLVGTITMKVANGDVVIPINLPGRVEVGR